MKLFLYRKNFWNITNRAVIPPQKVNHGLYAEQFSGSAFTEPRTTNKYSWLYRIRPSVCQSKFESYNHPKINRNVFEKGVYHPNPMRWSPLENTGKKLDFIDSLHPWVYTGKPEARSGLQYIYTMHLYR